MNFSFKDDCKKEYQGFSVLYLFLFNDKEQVAIFLY